MGAVVGTALQAAQPAIESAVLNVMIQRAGHDEVASPAESESVVAAAGLPGFGDFSFAPVAPLGLPRRRRGAALRRSSAS